MSLTDTTYDVPLTGCHPEPLASYLKALGVLRLVAEQVDADASGWWQGEHFVLRSRLDHAALLAFFADDWHPTPVIAPWNGGSGFYPKDNTEAADSMLVSDDPRLGAYQEAIRVGRDFIAARGWTERPADEKKGLLLSAMRAQLSDEALAWLDAAVVLGDERPLFPPLLGTGGNDGRLDFSNNFQQRVVEVLFGESASSLDASLFGSVSTMRFKGTMGQYHPAANDRTNPWDFVLLIEGALMFASAASRRHESAGPSMMAFPFHARAAGGLATLTDSDEAESRDELWLPLWSRPATLRELRRLFSEGRATVGSGDDARPAASALDFARAIAALGVDRGVDEFVRIGFHVRNGLAYFATPLGRFAARDVPSVRLLDDIDSWYERFRAKTSGKNVPSRIVIARRRLEQALFDAAQTGKLGSVLLELGAAEVALSRSLTFSTAAFLRPVRRLSSAWAEQVCSDSLEQRLAAALAARPGIRRRMLPLDPFGTAFGRGDEPELVFADRPLVDNLHALLLREDVEALQKDPGPTQYLARSPCSLTDIARFIDHQTDDDLIERWLRGILLIDGPVWPLAREDTILPPATFAILSSVHTRQLRDDTLPRTTGVLARACAGDAIGSTTAAIRRLNAASRPVPVPALIEPTHRMRRIAAALAFPLTASQRRKLERMVLAPNDNDEPAQDSQEQPS